MVAVVEESPLQVPRVLDVCAVEALLRRLDTTPPGPGPMAVLAELGARAGELTPGARVELAGLWERQLAWAAACQYAAIAAAAGPEPDPAGAQRDDWVRDELALAMGVAPGTAWLRVRLARELAGRLAPTAARLRAGELSLPHARAMADAVRELDDAQAATVQGRALGKAPGTPGQFQSGLRRLVTSVDPEAFAARHSEAKKDRRVEVFFDDTPDAPDAMGTVWAKLTAVETCQVWNALVDHAKPAGPGDDRGVGERLADALINLITGRAKATRPTTEVVVTIDYDTLIGMAERPADLAGYGPIPADLARELAEDATWRRLVTDPVTGHCLDYGHRVYRTPAPLARFLRARHPRCVFPGCTRRAAACQLDHTKPFDKGGQTAADNEAPLCVRHHRLKTHAPGWHLDQHHDGSLTWTTPSERQHDVDPHKYVDPTEGWPLQPPDDWW